ncbi:MAG TPA: pyruvate kinase [Alphaproteobacteria bacterium]|nr:pyruvate kinase [Alphaproteobacteria bacterium]
MRRNRAAKIIATLGPASSSPEKIEALFRAGADVFRLNFSHGSQEDHRGRFEIIRDLEQRIGRPIAVMADLQGPKLRLGRIVDGGVELAEGQGFRLDMERAPGNVRRAPLPHPEIFAAISPGTELLLDDGKLKLRVDESGADYANTVVIAGGRLAERKGVNVPNAVLALSPLTDKDRADLAFALELGVDWVALSFVQRPEDVSEARRLIAGRAAIIIKLEKPAAIDCLDQLIDLSDAIMVARGDLGVELPPEDVPGLQKRIITVCRLEGKPVVVATQMLESMIHSPAPTRAEASDVATAVYDGADAVMLSAESASGDYPLESVKMMNRIIARTERDPLYRKLIEALHPELEATAADAISAAAAQVAHTVSAAAIITYTTSGSTALRVARQRPEVPILCLTSQISTARRLALAWGAHCVETEDISSFGEMVGKACGIAHRDEFARPGQRVVVTAGVPFGTPGATNVLRIAWVEE